MSADLLDMVKGAMSDEIMGKLGGLLGQSEPKKTSSMLETAVGSILGGIMKKATSPDGAREIFQTANQHDDSILDNLGDLFSGGGREAKVEKAGNNILDMVFGKNTTGILNTIAKFLGINESIVKKLMGLAAPLVMSVIGRQIKNKALDAVGLSKLLGNQKSVLSKALPSSLASSLGFSDLLGEASDTVRSAGAAAANTGRGAYAAADDAAAAGGSFLKFLLPLILLAALAWIGYTYFIKPGAEAKVPDKTATAGTAMSDKSDVDFSDIDFSNIEFGKFNPTELRSKFEGITTGLKNVTEENAAGLATKIKDLSGSIDELGINTLPAPAKTAVGTMIDKFINSITSSLKDITNASILAIIKPVVDILIDKLNQFK